tara:strand:+ start:15718 stop:16068 length:351 start_codon:yes stop_codon:yes gene_type:complete
MKKETALLNMGQEYAAACERTTGKSVEEWKVIWAESRRKGFASGALSLDRVWTIWESSGIMRKFGLMPEDMEMCEGTPTGKLEADNEGYKAPSHEGEISQEAIGVRLVKSRFPEHK